MLCAAPQRLKVQQQQPCVSQGPRGAAVSLALSVVGARVEVWWEADQCYYPGRITHYNTGRAGGVKPLRV